MLFPNLPWQHYYQDVYKGCFTFTDKLQLSLKNANVAFDFFPRILYIRLFLFLGYLGIILAFIRRKYFMIFILVVGVGGGAFSTFLSHIEYRYVVPFYWPFAFFVGYLFWELNNWRKRVYCKDR